MLDKLFKVSLIIISIQIAFAEKMRYFIPHSHDDLGWIMTVQKYYNKRVKNIFDSVIDALSQKSESSNPNLLRKFVYSEVGFLKIYIEENPGTRKDKIDKINQLLNNNQWEFVNGGISQSDSACPHYEDIIENYYYGLSYIKRNFDQTSTGAWQLDPFGHSKALLYIARLFGMKHAVINRIGDFKKADMFKNHTLEFVEKFPDNLSQVVHVTTHHYGSPNGVNCDGNCDFSTFNKNTLDTFLNEYDKGYAYNPYHLVGGDFQYQHAHNNFDFLDKVLGLYSNIKYSRLSDYLLDFEAQAKKLSEFEGDFFVYDEANGDNWSGYFTSKPLLKNKIKRLGKLLRAFKNLYFTLIIKKKQGHFEEVNDMLDISESFGVLLHHDCITGTAKRAVDEDYFKRIKELEKRLNKIISKHFNNEVQTCDINAMITGNQCIINDATDKNELYINLFNSSYYNYNNRLTNFKVIHKTDYDIQLKRIDESSQLIDIDADIICKGKYCDVFLHDNTSSFSITKYKIVYVKKNNDSLLLTNNVKSLSLDTAQEIMVTDDGMNVNHLNNGEYETADWFVIVSEDKVVINSKDNPSVVNSIFYEYLYSEDSGAYILKYNGKPKFKKYNRFGKTTLSLGNFADTVFISGDRIDLTITFDKNYKDLYEIRSYIKKNDKFLEGIDVILNVQSIGITNKEFITDSNGLFEMKRQRNIKYENSIYPVASFIKIEDDSGKNMTVFVDRAEGGTSLEVGNIKLYIQRSAIRDDHKGVHEILMVYEDISVTHKILNSNRKEYAERFADIINMIEQEPTMYYSLQETAQALNNNNLKDQQSNINLRVVTDLIDDKTFFIRIQNVNRQNKVSETYTYKDLLTQIYGTYTFEEVPFDYLFNKNEKDQKLQGVDSLVDIEPLNFKTFIARSFQ